MILEGYINNNSPILLWRKKGRESGTQNEISTRRTSTSKKYFVVWRMKGQSCKVLWTHFWQCQNEWRT